MIYDFQLIEKKWQARWKTNPPVRTKPAGSGKKYYCLDMFPYPSGSGLHVGHWRGYVLSDVYARIKWLQGYNVLHPMGWDAFGLPAENAAIKEGIHPKISTENNIARFKEQLQSIAAIYDWDKELNTTDPAYYKWTQWIFLQMYKAGLAYQSHMPINWCSSCKTGLANEEVINGLCERCNTKVEKRKIRQWVLRITSYAQKLLDGLETLAWPEKVKLMQKNWIGRSDGLLFNAYIKIDPSVDSAHNIPIQMYSHHFEAFMADTFVAIAPDHPLLVQILETSPHKDRIHEELIRITAIRESMHAQDEPEGIFTGCYVHDYATQSDLPLWIASYVFADYGTGIVRCSAHDQRDFAFAKKYGIFLKVALVPEDPVLRERVERFEECFSDMEQGILLAPSPVAGKRASQVRKDIIDYCVRNNFAIEKTHYKLRDWIFSRQRYWGEPIPLVHCATCGVVPVPEDQLPVTLPDVEHYEPTGTGESPLAAIASWVNTICPSCHGPAKRETNTMPQWAGSCWYFLRYPNTHLQDKPFDAKDMAYWLPVDLYVGGIEHAILHLLYARFYVKVLHDLGYLSFDEPFVNLFNQGMVLRLSEKSGLVEKMSKSKGNVVSPDDIVARYGSDALRMYILFMGPPELDCEWQDSGLEGIRRFLQRLWTFMTDANRCIKNGEAQENELVAKRVHRFVHDFQDRLDYFKPNTAIASCMELLNDLNAIQARLSLQSMQMILTAMSVMIPHMTSELLEHLLGKQWEECTWPVYDAELVADQAISIAIQVNGKLRGDLSVSRGARQEEIEEKARALVSKWLVGTIQKVIFVPDRLINFVVT